MFFETPKEWVIEKPILHRAIQSVIELEGIAIQLILYLQEKNNVI